MTDTEKMPAGCRELTFDPRDRKTWAGKMYGGPNYRHSRAEIVHLFSNGNVLAVVTSDDGEFSIEVETDGTHRGGFRLYDAAPEPGKPREWTDADRKQIADALRPFAREHIGPGRHTDWTTGDFRRASEALRLIEAPVPEDRT